ncbi:transcriptional regulator with XRE-family HTH domain [Endobacter medicaginis]|uniref:Helix-turn-helix transcriptional regulator n=1 Tax=Endobacter medicaginis TaxID=1181271 RepID=A0A850NTN6_9PROT|nr:helix-turn-helix transcriptional regulator [Endobacter medicaginis]MBB3172609.1 transcriptional regulator with XRE-family HTH domain [Endobacter medicaginis]MCX5476856.1 helix-turn-helix transcriptional regulator [Endobacter medicaginis]NVN29387.1 helix-turn-helix transcriptional regulator [Endobacter medicaginis]
MVARKLDSEANTLRDEFFSMARNGELGVADGVRRMRDMLSMTQPEFGERFGLTKRQVSELENGHANPKAETLARLGKPFGLSVGFVRDAGLQATKAVRRKKDA